MPVSARSRSVQHMEQLSPRLKSTPASVRSSTHPAHSACKTVCGAFDTALSQRARGHSWSYAEHPCAKSPAHARAPLEWHA
eukprot:350205-Rhodomonas_salina.3